MTRDERVNGDFLRTLRSAVGSDIEALAGVAETLGAEEYEDLSSPEDYPVLGFHIAVEGNVLRVFCLTPGRFNMYERSNSGDYLMITSPIERIRRVSQSVINQELVILVEVEADRSFFNAQGESLSGVRANDGNPANSQTVGRMVYEGTITPNSYRIVVPADANSGVREHAALFGRALRSSIGY